MNKPDKSGVWQMTSVDDDTLSFTAIVNLDADEVQLPVAEAPFRLSDLLATNSYDWTYLREKYRPTAEE